MTRPQETLEFTLKKKSKSKTFLFFLLFDLSSKREEEKWLLAVPTFEATIESASKITDESNSF